MVFERYYQASGTENASFVASLLDTPSVMDLDQRDDIISWTAGSMYGGAHMLSRFTVLTYAHPEQREAKQCMQQLLTLYWL